MTESCLALQMTSRLAYSSTAHSRSFLAYPLSQRIMTFLCAERPGMACRTMDAASSSLDASFFHMRYPRGDCQVRDLALPPHWDAEHEADEAVAIQVAAAIVCSMVEELRHVLERFPELGCHCIIDAEEYRLRFKVFRHQLQVHGRCHVHEPGVVHFRIGTGVIESVQRLLCDTRQEMPVEKAYGTCRFHCQYGQHQQEQRLGSRGRGYVTIHGQCQLL